MTRQFSGVNRPLSVELTLIKMRSLLGFAGRRLPSVSWRAIDQAGEFLALRKDYPRLLPSDETVSRQVQNLRFIRTACQSCSASGLKEVKFEPTPCDWRR